MIRIVFWFFILNTKLASGYVSAYKDARNLVSSSSLFLESVEGLSAEIGDNLNLIKELESIRKDLRDINEEINEIEYLDAETKRLFILNSKYNHTLTDKLNRATQKIRQLKSFIRLSKKVIGPFTTQESIQTQEQIQTNNLLREIAYLQGEIRNEKIRKSITDERKRIGALVDERKLLNEQLKIIKNHKERQ